MPGITTTISAAVSPNSPAPGGFTWYRNGVIVPGENNSTIVVDVDHLGEYYATVNDVNGCNSQSGTVTITDSSSNIVFIYPSPTRGIFQVRYLSQAGNRLIPRYLNIFDAKGSRVYSRVYSINAPYEKMSVDMTAYGNGVYTVELADGSGQRIATGRVIVTH